MHGVERAFPKRADMEYKQALVTLVDLRLVVVSMALLSTWLRSLGSPKAVLWDQGGELLREVEQDLEAMGTRLLRSAADRGLEVPCQGDRLEVIRGLRRQAPDPSGRQITTKGTDREMHSFAVVLASRGGILRTSLQDQAWRARSAYSPRALRRVGEHDGFVLVTGMQTSLPSLSKGISTSPRSSLGPAGRQS